MRRIFPLSLLVLMLVLTGAYAAAFRHSPSASAAAVGVNTKPRAYLPLVSLSFPPIITGTVLDNLGTPVVGARVRIQTSEEFRLSAEDGTFTLPAPGVGYTTTIVTAWAPGAFVGWAEGFPNGKPLTITLRPYYTTDNPNYDWFSHDGDPGSLSCSHCMPAYTEWVHDQHSQSAVNVRVMTMYNGTDVDGNQSPLTHYDCIPDYGCFPLPPDPTLPYYGPGYKLDFPSSAGNCASCHAPAAAAGPQGAYAADMNELSSVEQEGVFCEYCHKVGDIRLDQETDMPYPNLPGVLSSVLFRPEEGEQLFFGNFDDVTRRVSYLPLMEESAYCAPCHHAVFWDTVVYNSYGEWLSSPYADPFNGQTCQDCHMKPVDYPYFVYPEQGGLIRSPARIYSHYMPGARDEELLQNSVTMTASLQVQGQQVTVNVRITNDKTGHHVPTDSPVRHLLLLVEAEDALGIPLTQTSGSSLPNWAGEGDPVLGYYAGLPGKAYARVLEELWTHVYPSGAYWNHTIVRSDNRLAAFESDVTTYGFSAPAAGTVRVHVRLLYRRAFRYLADLKGWDDPDILMEEVELFTHRP